MAYIEIGGARFHYELDGPADAGVVVLSNSLGTNFAMWDAQISALRGKFRVLRYDSRGHGLSEDTPGPYTIEVLGRDVVGLLDALQIERAHYCGLSVGGMIGQWLGIHAAKRFRSLILCNTAARIGTLDGWNARIATVRAEGMAAIASAVVARWFTEDFIKRAPEEIERVRKMLLQTSAEGYVATCAAIRDMDQREEVARVSVPTLVISGAHDAVTPPAEGKFLVEHIRGAKYVGLNAAHLSNIEDAGAFTGAVMEFLAEQEAK
jgi:3-oxoadipate enol-lactonase